MGLKAEGSHWYRSGTLGPEPGACPAALAVCAGIANNAMAVVSRSLATDFR